MSETAPPPLPRARPAPGTAPVREAVVRALRQNAPAIRRHGVARLWLYGSVARGEATPASDVDLLVDVEPGTRFSLVELSALRLELGDLLGREVQVAVRGDLGPAFMARIRGDLAEVL